MSYSEEAQSKVIQLLPILLRLKGNDGKTLISEKHVAEQLAEFSYDFKNSKNLQTLFNGIKDEKGNLPISREAFDIHNSEYEYVNGQNQLLYHLQSYTEEDKKYASEILPTLMALKDKDGKPIISQENIDKFPEYDDLASIVKSYKVSQVKAPSKTNTMDQIKIRYGEDGKLVSIKEFLQTENLSGITKKIQDSTKTLYQLNETENPLFHSLCLL